MLPIYSYSISIIVGFIILIWVRNRLKESHDHTTARQRAERKRQARDKRRAELLQLLRTKYSTKLPDRVLSEKIAHSTAVELLDSLRKKEFTYTQVVLVQSLRAIKIGQELNCTTEEFFDQAIEEAEKLDENNNHQDELLLKGIPISIKDQINQKGADSTMGISMRNFRPSSKDSLPVTLLKQQGAHAGFVRTATIQGMMLPETESVTYGTAKNPFDQTRTPGGSSGGDGALIAARGTPIGIGSDIGGSIRIPAHFCGLFGFKPTPDRISSIGVGSPHLRDVIGETNLHATIGPLARCTDDLVLVMRAFLQENMWREDIQLVRQPWREERFQDKKKLTIGFYTNDNWFSPAPACIRAVNEAAEALRELGHTVIPYTPIDTREAVRLFAGLTSADGLYHLCESFENEAINPMYVSVRRLAQFPNFLRPLVAYCLDLYGERRDAHLLRSLGAMSAYQYFNLITDLIKYTQKWINDLREKNIDLLLTPVNALPAIRFGQSARLFSTCSYTVLFNLLRLPAGVVPMTVVRDDEQYYEEIGEQYNDIAVSIAKDVCRGSAGLPIGIQLVGLPNDDERVLGVMKQLEGAVKRIRSPVPDFAKNIDIYTD